MKKSIMLVLFLGIASPNPCYCDDSELFAAIMMVESSEGKNLIGDNGKALGPYQIHRIYWDDACQYGKVSWDYGTGAFDQTKSEQVIRWYWEKYRARSDYEKACLHHGGPSWRKSYDNERYWGQILRYMPREITPIAGVKG